MSWSLSEDWGLFGVGKNGEPSEFDDLWKSQDFWYSVYQKDKQSEEIQVQREHFGWGSESVPEVARGDQYDESKALQSERWGTAEELWLSVWEWGDRRVDVVLVKNIFHYVSI